MIDAVSGLKNAVLVLIIVVAGHVLLPPPDSGWPPPPRAAREPPPFSAWCPPGGRCAADLERVRRDRGFGGGSCGRADHPSAPLCDGLAPRGASLRVLPARGGAWGAGGPGGPGDRARAELASAEELYRFANEPASPPPLRRPAGTPPARRADARAPAPPPRPPAAVEGATEDMACVYAPAF